MNIDKIRLRADIAELARDAKVTKALLRTTWTRPMADEQKKLVCIRRQATILHVLLAWTRGKKHVTTPINDNWYTGRPYDEATWHTIVAERAAKDYVSLESAS
jgi:hypothetical protein